MALYTGVAGLLVAILAEFLRSGIAAQVVNSATLLLALNVFLLALVTGQVAALRMGAAQATAQLAALRENVNELAGRARLSMRYYGADRMADLHDAAERVIRRAPSGAWIMAVNSYLEVFANGSERPSDIEAQRRYLRAFIARFPNITYHRLVQVPHSWPFRRPHQLADVLSLPTLSTTGRWPR